MSYEFALLRYTIASALGGDKLKLKDFMLSKVFTEAPKDWDWMTDEEKAGRIAASKRAWGR